MEGRKATDVLGSVFARLYEQFFLLDKNASGGQMIQEGNWLKVESFNEWCKDNLEHCYEGDDVTFFLGKITSEAITKALTYEDEYVVEFSVAEEDAVHRKCMKAFACRTEDLICVCMDDITQQYLREQSRERIAGESLEIAQRASIARDVFWQNMSDEIRLPVAQAVEMLSVSLQKGDEDARTYVKKAVAVLEKYATTMDGVFSVSAMEKGAEFERDDVMFTSDFVNDLRQMVTLQTEGMASEITIGSKGERVSGFISDQLRLKQMLGNALTMMALKSADNTAKATFDFDIRKETENEEGVYDLIFSIFAKGAEESVLQTSCMIFVQRLVDSMDGIMRFKTEGENAELSIRVPVQHADKDRLREAKIMARMTDSLGNRDFEGFRALVVDDDVIGREIAVSKLEQFGLCVETAADGEEAMEKLVASPRRYYQIVLMKMYLPKKSGLELTMELRELTRRDLNDITIVAVTSNPMRDKRLTALEHGMDHHIVLPFNDIELKEILLRELENIGPEEAHEKFGFRILK